jgi:hypothetical protein
VISHADQDRATDQKGAGMGDQLDVTLQNEELLAEAELCTTLMIATSMSVTS